MKNIFKVILICLVITGCTTTAVQHTIYQQQIEQKKEKLKDDAKDFLVKATQMLQVNTGTIDVKRVQMLLEKSQSLLGVDVDDGKELRYLEGPELDKIVEKITEEGEKEKISIQDLKKKDEEEVGKLVASNIEFEILKKDQAARNRKFYTICTVILAIISAAIYFMPAGTIKWILSIFKR